MAGGTVLRGEPPPGDRPLEPLAPVVRSEDPHPNSDNSRASSARSVGWSAGMAALLRARARMSPWMEMDGSAIPAHEAACKVKKPWLETSFLWDRTQHGG